MCSEVDASIWSSNAHLIEIQFLSSWVDRLKLDGHLTTEAQVQCSPGDKLTFLQIASASEWLSSHLLSSRPQLSLPRT